MEEETQIKISPYRLKRFLTLTAQAYQNRQQKEKDLDKIQSHLNKIKSMAEKKSTKKKELHAEVDNVTGAINEILNREKTIVEKQRQEAEILVELKKRIENMEQNLIEAAQPASEKLDSIKEINKINLKLDEISKTFNTEITEIKQKEDKMSEKLSKITEEEEQEIKQIQELKKKEEMELQKITELETELKEIEKKHKQLKRKKDVKPAQVKRIEKIILNHKKKLDIQKNKFSIIK